MVLYANRARGAAAAGVARSARVGDIVPSVVDPLLRQSAVQSRLLAALEEYAGSAMLDQLTGVSLRGGVLTLEVAEPALRYSLRLQWEGRILDMARRQVPQAGVHTVRFVLRRGQ